MRTMTSQTPRIWASAMLNVGDKQAVNKAVVTESHTTRKNVSKTSVGTGAGGSAAATTQTRRTMQGATDTDYLLLFGIEQKCARKGLVPRAAANETRPPRARSGTRTSRVTRPQQASL